MATAALPGLSEVATFTDSRGGTTLFKYALKAEWSPMQAAVAQASGPL